MPATSRRHNSQLLRCASISRRAAGFSEPDRYSSRLSITTACISFFPVKNENTTPQPTLNASLSGPLGPPASGNLPLSNPTARPYVSASHQTGSAIQALRRLHQFLPRPKQLDFDGVLVQIGRASCRDRV